MVDKFLKNTKVKLSKIIKQQKQQYVAMTHTAMSDKQNTISYLQWHTYLEISNFSCELFLLHNSCLQIWRHLLLEVLAERGREGALQPASLPQKSRSSVNAWLSGHRFEVHRDPNVLYAQANLASYPQRDGKWGIVYILLHVGRLWPTSTVWRRREIAGFPVDVGAFPQLVTGQAVWFNSPSVTFSVEKYVCTLQRAGSVVQ